ncbi:hypothetical protein VTN00DRAFT_6859 [Thermoascus crustaceus]|uniref:uncharacterized protein n=1 Tax=Thermoascus crustaceus TaxID=5088 RepID=UPI00374269F5
MYYIPLDTLYWIRRKKKHCGKLASMSAYIYIQKLINIKHNDNNRQYLGSDQAPYTHNINPSIYLPN